MFNKSLWLILLTILGGFFFYSPAASADIFICASSMYSGCSANQKQVTFAGSTAAMSCEIFGGTQTGYAPNTRRTQCSDGFAPSWYYTSSAASPDNPPLPFDESGECVPDTEFGMCQPEEDWDNDGTPNFQDEDSPAYDPDYCSSNPLSQYACEDDDSGDDDGGDDGSGGGGSDGGGDSGGGGLPSSCEGSPTFSESCCREHAEAQCIDSGGLADWGLVSIGSPTCNYTCNNDGDNGSDPGDDGGSGDDGSGDQTDNSDVVNAINQLKDSNITEFGQFKEALDSLVAQTSQQTDDLVAAQQNNTDTLSNDLSTLNETNQTGFEALSSQLEAIKNNTAQDSPTNPFLADIAENTSRTNELLEIANDQYFSQNGALMGIESEIMANGDTLGDISGQLGDISDSLNPDGPVPSPDSFGDGDFGGAAAGSGIGDVITDRFGELPDGLPNEVIDLSKEADKFKPILRDTPSDCPANPKIDLGVAEFTLNWNPICDLFGILKIFLIASATIAVPFIILGTGKN